MFTVEHRDQVRERLLELAAADPDVVGAAVVGSYAAGHSDRWSDVDLAFAIEGDLSAALERWTRRLYQDLGALHHWDLRSGATVYRMYLLAHGLEVDLAFAPVAEFAPRGPHWRTVFGQPSPAQPVPARSRDHLAGLAWHHALHARACLERQRRWQAEYWISALRDLVVTSACVRSGLPADYAKGAHLLPEHLTAPLEATLVQSLDEVELRRALTATLTAWTAELERSDPDLSDRLRPLFAELGATVPPSPDVTTETG
ncbi:MAG TPA: nucleotidyltransferase domain-containing protein [Micromonosporaceae bacterium]